MPETYAERRRRVLERERVEILGADASITLLADGTQGRAFDDIVTVAFAFFVRRESSIAIGAEFLGCDIAEQAGVDHACCIRIVAAKYRGLIYKASVVAEFIDEARVLSLRLTAGEG